MIVWFLLQYADASRMCHMAHTKHAFEDPLAGHKTLIPDREMDLVEHSCVAHFVMSHQIAGYAGENRVQSPSLPVLASASV